MLFISIHKTSFRFFFCQFTGGFSTYLLRSNVANLRNVRCWRVRPSLPKSTPLVRYNQKPRNVKTGASYCGTQRQLTHSQINQQLTCLGEKTLLFPPQLNSPAVDIPHLHDSRRCRERSARVSLGRRHCRTQRGRLIVKLVYSIFMYFIAIWLGVMVGISRLTMVCLTGL